MAERRIPNGTGKIQAIREIDLPVDVLLRALLGLDGRRSLSLLDSCGTRGPAARLLIAGFDPFETIEARGSRLLIRDHAARTARYATGDVLDALDERLEKYGKPGRDEAREASLSYTSPAAGACIATFSYDLARRLEPLRRSRLRHRVSSEEPDAVLAFYDTLVIHDYEENATRIVSLDHPARVEEAYRAIVEQAEIDKGRAIERTEKRVATGQPVIWDSTPRAPVSNMTRDEYLLAVERIKGHIAAGDIYQANLTQRLIYRLAPAEGPEDVFLRLRREHPASFAAFIRRGTDTVVSASPERFLRVEVKGGERAVEAWPIKGTRPRGHSPAEDYALRLELQQSEKERAENVMIVDLLRNDLGRVCRYGSVSVRELCAVEEHPTLFHLVSKVEGVLREEVTAGDLLRAAFPCGSVTGAPKIRAMEILDQIENVPRGLSMGALGYFGFDGALDLSVAIRTMVVGAGGRARFNVGGGIVADSVPELEYEESLLKARALLRALGPRAPEP